MQIGSTNRPVESLVSLPISAPHSPRLFPAGVTQAILTDCRINGGLVRSMTAEFPGGGWQRLHSARLHVPKESNVRARVWAPLEHVYGKGGNYAFLFPVGHFAKERRILLDGPARRKIPFCFSTESHAPTEGLFVAYVGKAANLGERFEGHFSLKAKSTAAQVQHGLVKSGVCANRESAVDFMLEHATIVYRELPGDEHAANRDLLELSLCAAFAPPFNIKSER